ncbi:MAG: YfiR family protein [Verrucomicrobia bacterium]|nr:YfiR family protein [Verrucomicrobiota bacterium]
MKNRRKAVDCRILLSAVLYLALSVFSIAGAESFELTEARLKAAATYGIAKFIHWPENAFPDPEAPVVFAVLGEDPFGADLKEILKDKTINGRPVIVMRSRQLKDLMQCHILFISDSEEKRIAEILEAVQGHPILTVADIARFPEQGGILNVIMDGRRVAFEINLSAANRASLTVESRLSKLARKIHTDPLK